MKSSIFTNRILIDPGHVGKNFFDFRHFEIDNIEFHEGDFCYAWAESVQNSLLGKVEHVGLSRGRRQPSTVISKKEKEIRLNELLSSIGIEEALKKFRVPVKFFSLISHDELLESAIQNEADLINRAKLALEQNYDICLSLHLNGDPTNIKTEQNGICGLTNKLSINHYKLFEKIIKNISKMTGLPIIKIEQLEEVRIGVFVDESLTLLKHIKIPTLLIEGPFQNNPIELQLLNQSLINLDNVDNSNDRLAQLTSAIVSSL